MNRRIFTNRRPSNPEVIVGVGLVVCIVGMALILIIWG